MKFFKSIFNCLRCKKCFKLKEEERYFSKITSEMTEYIPCNQTINEEPINQTTISYEDTIPFIPPVKEGIVVKIYDGDTITIASKLPIDESPLYRFSVRLSGIDCPEIKTTNNEEKIISTIAKNELMSMIYLKKVKLENVKTEKYGRLLADVYFEDLHLNKHMIEKRLAVKYDGKTKILPKSWTNYYYNGITNE